MKEYPKLILTRPKLVLDIYCPKCKSFDIIALPELNTQCNNCKINFTTTPNINIYYSIAKKLTQLLSNNNGLYILGERANIKTFHPDDILKPRNKLEDDVWQTMLAIRKNYTDMKCWEVGNITNEYDTDYKTHCNTCGTCRTCVTCTKCNSKYVPKRIKATNEKRYTCPKCKSKDYKPTMVKGDKCPYCEGVDIKKTTLNAHMDKCPRCNSTKIQEPRKIPVYRLLIERQRRNWIDE